MRPSTFRTLLLCTFLFTFATSGFAQSSTQEESRKNAQEATPGARQPSATPVVNAASGNLFGLDEVQRQLREQRAEIERLRATLDEQARAFQELRARIERAEQASAAQQQQPAAVENASYTPGGAPAGDKTNAARGGEAMAGAAQGGQIEERVARAEEAVKKTSEAIAKQLGSITFGGDIRFRYESTYGQQNASPSGSDPLLLGNPLSSRQRLRLRLRFGARGSVGKEFEWGLRLASGNAPDVISTNQTLTDFFTRKNFGLDHAYIIYKPARLAGFQVQAGKFDVPWTRTEMTIDNDVTPEGLNESYTRAFKNSVFKSVSFVAWQLPFLERNAAFVVGANGRVNLEESRRAGRDLALYGGQLRTRLEPSKQLALTLSAADLFYSGTQFITPAQFFGSNVQFPVTVTIPATATAPAQTVTTQVSIPRELLVNGNANLGLSSATTNAVNRDGRLSSGYNLVDLIARLDLSHSKRWPVMLLLNYVHNTQAHDVVTAGAGGASVVLPNKEDDGLWAEFQIGKTQQRGDLLMSYTFIRIEKDAVLTPFNYSDLLQFSDVRSHRLIVAYAVDPRVTLSLTGIFSQRPNGLLGAFGNTPPGSLNRTGTRLQLDTVLRF
ncbi:MAG TPA: putative porin [Pyrinomonadaceae bacterium]|nr:putative porin [Pyrinomonadaceae bacterium]